MKTYRLPLLPGPTIVAQEVLNAYHTDYGSADIESEFFDLYDMTQTNLKMILHSKNNMVLMNGEAMVVLWGALKSCLQPGDKVLAVATGVYGYGIGEMARSIGCQVETVGFNYNEAADPNSVEKVLKKFQPKMVTMVHCETPSGVLNPVAEVGQLVKDYSVPLFYVDAVSSVGGADVKTDLWGIDLCLAGTQKCFSAPPDVGIISVSDQAWDIIRQVNYKGYDALGPWETALANRWFPYTLSWHSTAALNRACQLILTEGLENVFQRHLEVAEYCRNRIHEMQLELFPLDEKYSSPTVTAVKIPPGIDWQTLDKKLRSRGMALGNSPDILAGKVFRIGHMGQQANFDLVEHGMDILEYILLLHH